MTLDYVVDYEIKLTEIINEYRASEQHRWGAAFAIWELWQAFPDRHGEIMAVLVNELHVTDDAIYNLLHAATLAFTSDTTRKIAEQLSPSHCSRLARAAEKYTLPEEIVIEYLEMAVTDSLSVQTLIEEVQRNHDPDSSFLFHRAVRVLIRACRRLLELAESNGVDKRVQDAARMLVEILNDKNRL